MSTFFSHLIKNTHSPSHQRTEFVNTAHQPLHRTDAEPSSSHRTKHQFVRAQTFSFFFATKRVFSYSSTQHDVVIHFRPRQERAERGSHFPHKYALNLFGHQTFSFFSPPSHSFQSIKYAATVQSIKCDLAKELKEYLSKSFMGRQLCSCNGRTFN